MVTGFKHQSKELNMSILLNKCMVETQAQLDSRLQKFDTETTRQVSELRGKLTRAGNPDVGREVLKRQRSRQLQRGKILEQSRGRKRKPIKLQGAERQRAIKAAQEAAPSVRAARERLSARERRIPTRVSGGLIAPSPMIAGKIDTSREVITPLRAPSPPRDQRFLSSTREPFRDFTGFRDEPVGRLPTRGRPISVVEPTVFEPGLRGTAQRLGRRASAAELAAERRFAAGEPLKGFGERGRAVAFGLGEFGAGVGSIFTQPGPAIRGVTEFGREFAREPRATTRRVAREGIREPGRTTSTFLGIAATGPLLGGVGARVTPRIARKPVITTIETTGRRITTPSALVDITEAEFLGVAGRARIKGRAAAVETAITPLGADVAFTARELGADITVIPPFGKPRRALAREQAIGIAREGRFIETAITEIKPGKKPVRPPLREVRVGRVEEIGRIDDIIIRRGTVLGFEETGRPVSVAAGIEKEIPITPGFAATESAALRIDNINRIFGGGGVTPRKGRVPTRAPARAPSRAPTVQQVVTREPSVAPVSIAARADSLLQTVVKEQRVTTGRAVGRRVGRVTQIGALLPVTKARQRTALGLETSLLGAPTRAAVAQQQIPITSPLFDVAAITRPVTTPTTIITPLTRFQPAQRFGGTSLFGPGGGLSGAGGLGVPSRPGIAAPPFPVLAFPGARPVKRKKVKGRVVRARKPGLKELSFRLFEDETGPGFKGPKRIFGPRPIPKRFKKGFQELDRILRL